MLGCPQSTLSTLLMGIQIMTGTGIGLQGGNKKRPTKLSGIMSQLKSWVNSLLLIDSASPVGVTSAINADCCIAAGICMPAKVHNKHPNQTKICQILKISCNTLLCICNSIQSNVWERWPQPHPSLCLQYSLKVFHWWPFHFIIQSNAWLFDCCDLTQ